MLAGTGPANIDAGMKHLGASADSHRVSEHNLVIGSEASTDTQTSVTPMLGPDDRIIWIKEGGFCGLTLELSSTSNIICEATAAQVQVRRPEA